MIPERIKLLIAALRSGQYQQTACALKKENLKTGNIAYCCLGVACEVARQNGLELTEVTELSTGADIVRHSFDGHTNYLPNKVKDWYGFGSYKGDDVEINGVVHSLGDHNDQGVKFNQIADALEKKIN